MCVSEMWGSGTQQSGAWGWPPPQTGSYTNDEEYDQSQGWAAAAAAWAQQRELRETSEALASAAQPPPPPGPPPMRPPLPTGDTTVTGETPVQIHDYMHGQQQPTEIIDYQHGKAADPTHQPYTTPQPLMATPVIPPITTDYNHMSAEGTTEEGVGQEWEVTSDNWFDYHPTAGQEFYNGGWTAESWNGDQAQYYAAAAQYYQNEYNANHSTPEVDSSSKGRRDRSADYSSSRLGDRYNKHSSSYGSDKGTTANHDSTEGTKKTKGLPLWLRQGLEKMDREKKKAEQLKAKKAVVGSHENSPRTSDKGNLSESDDDVVMKDAKDEETDEKRVSPKPLTDKGDKSDDAAASSGSDEESEEEDEKIDEETRFREIMMNVKTKMTEILLGVTNKEIKAVCNEVFLDVKRSAKVKATQLRRSGGLDALRSVGDGNATTSESESEDEKDQKSLIPNSNHSKGVSNNSIAHKNFSTSSSSLKLGPNGHVKVKREPDTDLPKSYKSIPTQERVKEEADTDAVSRGNKDPSNRSVKIKEEPETGPSKRRKNNLTSYTHVKVKEEPISSDDESDRRWHDKNNKQLASSKHTTNGENKEEMGNALSRGKVDIKKEREETVLKSTNPNIPKPGSLDIKIKREKLSDDESASTNVGSASATPTESKEAIAKQIDEIEKQINLIKNRKTNRQLNSIKEEKKSKSRSASPAPSRPVKKIKKEPESPSRTSASTDDKEDRLKYYKLLAEKAKPKPKPSSSSEEDSDSDSSDDTIVLTDTDEYDSSDSEREKRRSSKSKRSKRSSKKKSKRHRKNSSSDDEELSTSHRKKKRRKASTSSSDDSYYQKRKSSSKKKRSKKSISKSPSRPKKKR